MAFKTLNEYKQDLQQRREQYRKDNEYRETLLRRSVEYQRAHPKKKRELRKGKTKPFCIEESRVTLTFT